MKFSTIVAAIASVQAVSQLGGVAAHGGMTNPKPRALTTMGMDINSNFGHPMEMRGDCLNFKPNPKLQNLSPGKHKLTLRANDGANHIGHCKAYLVNPKNKSKKKEVGSLENCMRSLHPGPGAYGDAPIPGEMWINIPKSGLPCDNGHCVLEFWWEATHLQPYEHFNNCADVKISGGGGKSKSKPKPKPKPKPKGKSKPKPKPKPKGKAPAPKGGGGKYKYVGGAHDAGAMTTWCNQNCPAFCPADVCKKA